ncbi:SGNH/GDSL hydrolase family protein [Agromyces italicus]|uniref:SGNH/GDSL hydrolase family protein n=1 Tax=Agromyces italicus TaxID=279572 RepID=UPI0003B305B5|nr:SGNH/GDSL hydrolase family protein [Agromyces italicus]
MNARRILAGAAAAVVITALALAGAGPAFAAKGGGKPGGGGGGSKELAYVALGDSFASGQGGGSYLDTSCYRSNNSYPKRLDASRALKLTAFPACGGASTVEALVAQVPAIPAGTRRVTLTIGGNDVGFAAVMQNCFVFVSTTACEADLAVAESMVSDDTMYDRVASLIQAIRAKVGAEAKIVVAGYPQLFHLPSQYAYAARVNTDTSALNDELEAASAANGATFVDVEAAFAGHGIGSPSPWINAFSIFNTTAAFHPNSTGYASYATLLAPALR